MKIVKPLEESSLLVKGVSKAIAIEAKEQIGGFLGMLIGTINANLLGNILAGKEAIQSDAGTIRADKNF